MVLRQRQPSCGAVEAAPWLAKGLLTGVVGRAWGVDCGRGRPSE